MDMWALDTFVTLPETTDYTYGLSGSYLNSRAPPRYQVSPHHPFQGSLLTTMKAMRGLGTQMHERPDFPSWHDVQKSFPRTVPQDIYKSGTDEGDEDENSWDDRSPLFEIFDPTTVDVKFDHSCLNILDAQLLLHPFEAFADVCWADAVYQPATHDDSLDIQSAGPCYGSQPVMEHSDDDEEDDDYPDECRTPRGNSPSTPIYHPAVTSGRKVVGQSSSPVRSFLDRRFLKGTFLTFELYSGQQFADPFSDSPISETGRGSFLFVEPRFTNFQPSDSIGYSPSPSQRPTTLASRLATYFHTRAK